MELYYCKALFSFLKFYCFKVNQDELMMPIQFHRAITKTKIKQRTTERQN